MATVSTQLTDGGGSSIYSTDDSSKNISSSVSPTYSDKLSEFKQTVADVTKLVNSNQVEYTPYVKICIGEKGSDSYTEIETGDSVNNYITRLDVSKNGSGQANVVTIDLAFSPEPSIFDGNGPSNPNYIDYVLCKSNRVMSLQYGYTTTMPSSHLISPVYKLMITNYHSEMNDNVLIYTIDAVSVATTDVENTYTFETKENVKPTEAFKDAIDKYFEDYDFADRNGALGSDAIVPEIKYAGDNKYEYLGYVLAMAVDKSQSESTEDIKLDSKIMYSYIINDNLNSSGRKTIELIRVDPQDDGFNAENIVFRWGDKSNRMVRTFRADFDGIILMTANSAMANNGKDIEMTSDQPAQEVIIGSNSANSDLQERIDIMKRAKRQKVRDSRAAAKTAVMFNQLVDLSSPNSRGTSGDNAKTEDNISIDTWARAITAMYKAEIDLMGIPCEIPILSPINIIPLIWGRQYHTAGTYIITKITDRIDSEGFTTGLELFKTKASSYFSDTIPAVSTGYGNKQSASNLNPNSSSVTGSSSGGSSTSTINYYGVAITQKMMTKNRCYSNPKNISPNGIVVHSVGCSQPNAKVFYEGWNNPDKLVSVHAFIDDSGIYQTLPWTYRAWHAGKGSNGSANDSYIGFEICEPANLEYKKVKNSEDEWVLTGEIKSYDPNKSSDFFNKAYNHALDL